MKLRAGGRLCLLAILAAVLTTVLALAGTACSPPPATEADGDFPNPAELLDLKGELPAGEPPTQPAEPEAPAIPLPLHLSGRVLFVQGPVKIWQGRLLTDRQTQPGLAVQAGDLFQTGAGGGLDLELRAPGLPGAVLRSGAHTAFGLTTLRLAGQNVSKITLFAGSLNVGIRRIYPGTQLLLGLDRAEIALGAATVNVQYSVQGEGLVTCRDGLARVSLNGRELAAQPGTGVFLHRSGELSSLNLARADLADLQERWMKIQSEELPEILPRLLAPLFDTYPRLAGKYLRDWTVQGPEEGPDADKLGRQLAVLERQHFRLAVLFGQWQPAWDRLYLRPGRPLADLRLRFERDRQVLGEGLARVRKHWADEPLPLVFSLDGQ